MLLCVWGDNMPTDKKRVNLTIPEEVYTRLQTYRTKYGISTDAGACLQLIIRQLDSIDNGEKMMQMVSRFTAEELQQMATMGIPVVKQLVDAQNGSNDQ